MLLRLEGLGKSFGPRTLFRDVDLHVNAGDRIGLVGPNGAGKTTLLRIASGDDPPDVGRVLRPRGARIGMLKQEIVPGLTHSVREEAGKALAELDAMEQELRELETRMSQADSGEVPRDVAERYDTLHHRFEHGGGFDRDARIDRVLAGLGFDEEARQRPLATFSGGWLMRVELAKLLLADPDVLLLDEPTNHLDLPSIEWFEETLDAFRGGVIVISHDRTFLRRHVGRVAELARGGFTVYEGGYDYYLAERERRREEQLARKRSQDQQIAQTERFIERFRYKASKAKQVQSRVKALDKLERIEVDDDARRRVRLRIPEPARAGALPVELEGVHKRYGDQVVYRGIDFKLKRGERLALVGPNGAGKSTLLRILAGALDHDEGERRLGHRVEVGFYAQHQLESLDAGRTVYQELERVAHVDDIPRLRSHLGAFLFSGDDIDKKVSVLSGGEKARLALAKMLLRPTNVLVLDEPTNHLDVEACEVLEEALAAYQGTLAFVSHDRAFINALATRVVEVRAGELREFLGDYDFYLSKVAAPAAPEAAAAEGPTAQESAAFADELPAKERRRLDRERRKTRDRTQRRIQAIEAEILEKEAAVEALGHRLGDPDVYRDGEQVRTLEAERSALRAETESLYRDWERLDAELAVLEADLA